MRFSPEFEVALQCCRWNFPAGGQQPIQPSEAIDWEEFLRLVRFHRIQGLAWAALAHYPLPEDVTSELAGDAKAIAASNLKLAVASSELQEEFARAGVDLLFFKGLTLSALAYGDAFLKMSSDIDILVDPTDVERSAEILRNLGFLPFTPADRSAQAIARWHEQNKESAWLKPGTGIFVELHSRLVDNRRLIPGIGMASPRQNIQVGGRWAFPTLATDELLSYLFVHGAGSAWFRLKWISDVAAILSGMKPREIERLYRAARANQAGRAPAQALLLVSGLFDIHLSPALDEEFASGSVSRFLAAVAEREIAKGQEPTTRPGGTMMFRLTRPLLLEGWTFAVGEVSRQIQEVARWRSMPR